MVLFQVLYTPKLQLHVKRCECKFMLFCFVCFSALSQTSLFSCGYLGTLVDEAGLELTEILLPLPPSVGITGICHLLLVCQENTLPTELCLQAVCVWGAGRRGGGACTHVMCCLRLNPGSNTYQASIPLSCVLRPFQFLFKLVLFPQLRATTNNCNRSLKEKDLFYRDYSSVLVRGICLVGLFVFQRQGFTVHQAGLKLAAIFLRCVLVLWK